MAGLRAAYAQHARGAAALATVWLLGDFFAQFYAAHAAAAARRLQRSSRSRDGDKAPHRTRPSAAQMYAMLDKDRLAQAAAFGALLAYPLTQLTVTTPAARALLRTRSRLVAGVIVPAHATATPRVMCALCVRALALQQLVLTPLITWAYFNAMTGMRGGFAIAGALRTANDDKDVATTSAAAGTGTPSPSPPTPTATAAASASREHDVLALERYMVTDMLPATLVVSWAAYTPAYAAAWALSRRGGVLSWLLPSLMLLPWTAVLARTQEQQLL